MYDSSIHNKIKCSDQGLESQKRNEKKEFASYEQDISLSTEHAILSIPFSERICGTFAASIDKVLDGR